MVITFTLYWSWTLILIDGFNFRVSWELFDYSENPEQDVFQSVIEKHKKVGIDFKKNTWKNTSDTTKMKPLKLWKTLTGYTLINNKDIKM